MKKKRFLPVIMFLAGLFTGGGLLAIFAFASPNPPPAPVKVFAKEAKAEYRSFLSNASTAKYNDTIKAVFLGMDQYTSMVNIIGSKRTFQGFRVYYGYNGATKVALVVGVDTAGKDDTIPGIYRSTAGNLGPCPTVCDKDSPIVLK